MLKAAFQGVRGAYSETAVNQICGENDHLVPLESFEDVFNAVKDGEVDRGVLPVENSLTGSIHQNYDLLLQFDLQITGGTKVRIHHNLIANKGTKFSDIKKIYSHPQGLMQCQKFLKQFPAIAKIPAYDTAGSVRMIKEESMHDSAAIASAHAAEFYEMDILEKGIEDNDMNFTRFIMIEKPGDIPADSDRTSIVYSLDNRPGMLYKSLSIFAIRDIDLIKMESRPLTGKPWQYYFYLDFKVSMNDEKGQNAVKHLQEIAAFVKVLGSYKNY